MILYPTETLYALGVNVFDEGEMNELFALKGRAGSKAVSCLVRSQADIERYAFVDAVAAKLISQFLPGALTIVLRARRDVPRHAVAADGTLAFRISGDPIAQVVIDSFMVQYDAPMSCTSANVSGLPTLSTPVQILAQFGAEQSGITKIYDDGPRTGMATTIIKVVDKVVTLVRAGAIAQKDIDQYLCSGK